MKKFTLFTLIFISLLLTGCENKTESNKKEDNKEAFDGKNLELETDLEGIKAEREAEASLNFPEELIGDWSCNCGYEGIDEADNPPGFYIKETTEGYWIWYARTQGIVKEIKHTDNSYIVKYEDDDEGQRIIKLKLKNNRLNINGLTCESSGMERCSLDEKIKVLSH